MALMRLLVVVAVAAAVAASCRPALADPAVSALPGLPVAGLAVGFYNESCPQVEDLVLAEMRAFVEKDRTLGPAMLRFMFHDCLARGCDASLMLKSRSHKGEQDAASSYGLRGYDEIEQIKAKVEAACPLTVSCADIIALAARDAVYLSNGPRYAVETGRRDGKVSAKFDAENDLPPPSSNIVDLKTYFSVKGLGWKDLVVLSGSHTIGSAQCSTFASDRLYNFSGKGVQDQSLDKAYAASLREACEPGLDNDTTSLPMDPTSPYDFDLSYYRHVRGNTGLLLSDQALMDDRWTREYVERMAAAASPDEFFADFAVAMTNMGRLEVLTGGSGEIRETCAAYVD
ncbi:peroxidase 1-like [Panicum miliaceum]|uniref:Peroxidase n=1 Tax=Panicum miliaceum TaxID=4540 RepID=A0A3L6ST52_PANMI|nr:peroxidase 1-like [Panicum miliaceum]